ncbi:transcription repressor OFP3-like [Salvia hispanica]|uniref:transcription repressor OFP3-like n=1 Tax=Salvia hispanica TaxID=49212 RepID=UPI002009604A|nr:transcription repressor OFP3-like [Salvia hispanica]
MKWGRKASSPPSFGSSVITRVLPASWFSKFKPAGSSLDTGPGKKQQRGKLDFSTVNSSLPAGCRQARFYRLDDDAYWTLSFRKDRGVRGCEGRRRSSRINPLWYDSDDEFLVAVSGFREAQLPRKELETIPETDTIKMKQERCTDTVLREKRRDRLKKDNIDVRRSRKLRGRVKRKNRKAELGVRLDEGEDESSNLEEEQASPTQLQKADQVKEESHDSAVSYSRNHQNISFQTFGWSSDGEEDEDDHVSPDLDGKGSAATSERLSTSKCQNLENMKIEEFKKKTEEFRKEAAYITRRFRSRKVKRNRKNARGSRTESRIQALKGIKSKKKERESEEEAVESSTISNSFAVVKSSFNPQQDFRDSMVEMIQEKGIRHREELQELLACYLTLNSDRHHDLIINVFQQVWFELQLL